MKRTFHRVATFQVYILRCADGTYYTGSTNNLPARLKLHHAGNGAKYVRGRGPLKLVYAKTYRYYKLAVTAEKRLKRLARKRKEALISEYARRKIDDREADVRVRSRRRALAQI